MKQAIYIGFYTFAGYDHLMIANTEDECWKMMKRKYYEDRSIWGANPRFHTFKSATEYFGWHVEKASTGTTLMY
jgi:hypothetical protein